MLSPLCLAALLSGCGAARAPDIRLIEQPAPRHLLVCADRPEPPGSGRTQFDVALFVLALSAAHGECRSGRPLWPHADVRLTIEGARQSVHDLRALMAALRERGHQRVGVVGMSLGGFVTSLLATVAPDLDFCVPLIPLASFADWGKDHGTLPGTPDQRYDLHKRLEQVTRVISPMARPSLLSPAQVIVLAGDVDGINRRHHADMLAAHFDAPIATFRGGHVLQFGRSEAFAQALPVMRGE